MVESTPNNSKETWLNIWRNTKLENFPFWDEQCELVYNLLRSGLPEKLYGTYILETGSGTGRVSSRLAKEGAQVVLVDISIDAIRFTKKLFTNLQLQGNFILCDICYLPFKNNQLDCVWNSGVLEHFDSQKMAILIDDMKSKLKKDGTLIVIVPNKRAFFYNMFRVLDMKLGRWQWGYEEPLRSEEFLRFSHTPVFQRSTGFIYQLNFFSLPILVIVWQKLLQSIYPRLQGLDKRLPGYLIATVWKK